ncbi:3-ketoacyl-ACP reductase [Paenibacillus sp. FSL A5-0031]|uniref:SDR family NAD(P)-dependent oxidoreductase n=1 Tax=Paenibacillus sp. FSL A5-0031 TaxID=1920420 RepID=UPI00096CE28E|nr:SDR family oxidoreductase [Paenibacillus sp. FSL A5-0031]OME86109.1 3-ketoacyl-ACP reductase [Paenibacillus sp. FSL A5-0031]
MKAAHEDKVVLITGAGAGIGRALALAYAEQGALPVLVDKNEEGLEQTGLLLQEAGYDSLSLSADMSKPDDIIKMLRDLEMIVGRLDIVINNAGFGIWKSPYDLSIDEWDSVVNTNLRGTFVCTREAAKLMRTTGGGAIVNISSTRAMMSEPNSEAYAASKGGILSLTHAMAVSLGPDHITVNAICPGWIETGDYSKLRPVDHEQHPSKRVGKPEDIARACLYLTDPQNDFVTGTHITIDGGMTRKMIYEE